MKLYYAPAACSLADHIALHEAGFEFDRTRVNLKTHTTEDGDDYTALNPKGYVPALELDSGELLTENIAILDWITQQNPALGPSGAMGRTHLLEKLAFISTEIHKGFKPFFAGASEEEKARASVQLGERFAQIAEMMQGDYLFGSELSVADAYLFVMLTWADKNGVPVPDKLTALRERMLQRDAVRMALRHEGLLEAA